MGTTKFTCKICRREGASLCGRENCAYNKRPYPPGQHGPQHARKRRSRLSPYGIQLREKQKAKRLYGMRERQFRRYFEQADQKEGNTAEFLLGLLERRLDNVVYRLGLGKTRRQAKQLVNHGFFEVDGKKVDIPSYRVSVGEQITIKESKQKKHIVQEMKEDLESHEPPKWLSLDPANMTGKVTSMPDRDDVEQIFDPTLIVEFYSR